MYERIGPNKCIYERIDGQKCMRKKMYVLADSYMHCSEFKQQAQPIGQILEESLIEAARNKHFA
jgi:hypothetical protein